MPTHHYDGLYYGTVVIQEAHVDDRILTDVASRADSCGYLQTPAGPFPAGIGRRKIRLSVTDTSVRMTETATQEILQNNTFTNLVAATYVAKNDLVVVCVLSVDNRCAVQLAHIVQVGNGATLAAALMSVRPLKIARGSVVANKDARDILVQNAMYLGFIKVSKSKGGPVVAGAISKNSECRAALENLRLQQKLPRSGRLLGVSKSNDFGTHVQEYPCVLVITPRSFRIVDAVTGDTISKFFIKQVSFQAITPFKSKPEIFAVITENPNQSPTCHLFEVDQGVGKILAKAFQGLVKKAETHFKKEAGVGKVEKNVFTALEGYERERAPDEFFNKQIRRKFLVPVKVLGAGEFGEVWLADQTNVLASRKSTKMISKKRAVKMLKADASIDAKEEYLRECRMLLKTGGDAATGGGRSRSETGTMSGSVENATGSAHLVRLVGVALQQAPWLCVLEYVPYGDLRNVLKTAREKNIKIRIDEMLMWFRQLAAGCAHIASCRIIHMDLAARNVLLGEANMVKIADFGMSEEMDAGKNTKTFVDPIRCAIKWTAMEAMMENIFSEASDVWSLGIVYWEILMRGAMPYPGVNNVDMLYFLIGGDRIHQPNNCPEPVWDVMLKCWEENPGNRWTFEQLKKSIADLQLMFDDTPGEMRDLGIYIHTSKGEKEEEEEAKPTAESGQKKRKEKRIGDDGQSIYVYDEAWKPKQQAIDAANAAADSAASADAYDVALGAPSSAPPTPTSAVRPPSMADAYDVAIGAPASAPPPLTSAARPASMVDAYDVALADTSLAAPITQPTVEESGEADTSPNDAPLEHVADTTVEPGHLEEEDSQDAVEEETTPHEGSAPLSAESEPPHVNNDDAGDDADGDAGVAPTARRGSILEDAEAEEAEAPPQLKRSASTRSTASTYGFDGEEEPGDSAVPFGFDESELKEDEESELNQNSAYGYGFEQNVPSPQTVDDGDSASAPIEPPEEPAAQAVVVPTVPVTEEEREKVEQKFLRSLSRKDLPLSDPDDLDEC